MIILQYERATTTAYNDSLFYITRCLSDVEIHNTLMKYDFTFLRGTYTFLILEILWDISLVFDANTVK